MKVTCRHCGETLLGSVNRCWKCGQSIELQVEDDGISQAEHRPHCPFAPGGLARQNEPRNQKAVVLAEGTALASLILGLFALLLACWTGWALIPSLIGFGCGFWSLLVRRRRWAVVGCVLCLIALIWTGILAYHGLVDWYQLNWERGSDW